MRLQTPTWFRKELKRMDPRLYVTFNERVGKWEIGQTVKRQRYYGVFEGVGVARLEDVRNRIMYVDGLGSKIFSWIRMRDTSKYKDVRQIVKDNRLAGHEEL